MPCCSAGETSATSGLHGTPRQFVARPLELTEVGERIVVAIVETRRGKGSSTPVETQIASCYELWDRKMVRDRAFISKEAALEAAGLRE